MSESKEVSKYADTFMYKAEKSTAADGPTAYVLGGPVDPLGQVVACINMYKGVVVRDLADVTDEERREALKQIQKTVLTMPLEAVSLHFMVEGVHRGITHQMVRQRTAAFAQESTRFAVKEDLAEATALPPSLENTKSMDELIRQTRAEYAELGIDPTMVNADTILGASKMSQDQMNRLKWDEAVGKISETYNGLISSGMAAEEARGLMPTNITTRLNYITNLRSFYDTMSKRVGDQAQFEWRKLIAVIVQALRKYGSEHEYEVWTYAESEALPGDVEVQSEDLGYGSLRIKMRRSSGWQYDAIVAEIKPIEFALGHRAFGADFDRPSRIGERVDAFAKSGVPSDQWTSGSREHNIPPIHPNEWLLDPDSARLSADLEFDIWGNRVKKGTAFHWDDGFLLDPDGYAWTMNEQWQPVQIEGPDGGVGDE